MENSEKNVAVSFDDVPAGLYYQKNGQWVGPPEGKLTKIPDSDQDAPRRVKTNNYDIIFKQLQRGGPSGYESKYLTEEGEEAAPKVKRLLLEHQEKLADARNRMHEFILTTPLTSVFNYKK